MKITFELNPPKIVKDERLDLLIIEQEIQTLLRRASLLIEYVDGIHLTDSVLGVPRMSSITAARLLKDAHNPLNVSCSIRTRDRNFTAICQFVLDAILLGVDGLLVLMGDEPSAGPKSFGLKPSDVLRMLRYERYDSAIDLNLTIPSELKEISSIQRKIEAKPKAFVSQSIKSLSDLGHIVDIIKPYGIKIVACIMAPSEKNKLSAEMIGLDFKEYENYPVDFIRQASKIADEVLLTSPNSFRTGLDLLSKLKGK
jgi:homocysteine S-methyltransferase